MAAKTPQNAAALYNLGESNMLRHTGTPETVHFVNWLLHSGYVDALALADKAVSEAMSEGGSEDELAQRMRRKLAKMLKQAIPGWAQEFAPDYNHAEQWEFSESPDWFHEAGPLRLFAPLLASAIGRIDLFEVADHIYVYIGQMASDG